MRTQEQKAAHAAYMKEYYARNPEKREAKNKRDRERARANPEPSRAKAAEWYRNNKARATARNAAYRAEIQEIARKAKSQPCQRCGGEFPIEIMEFHHRDPSTKKGEVCNMSTPNLARAELAKCDVLCANCHRAVEAVRTTCDECGADRETTGMLQAHAYYNGHKAWPDE